MIAANRAVARHLSQHEQPALYRVHAAPDPDRLEELDELLRPLGLELPADETRLHPQALQDLLAQTAGSDREAFVSTLVLRSLARAEYRPDCGGHFALSARYYSHFTSPIRRYPDLVVHRQLKALIRGDEPGQGTLGSRLEAIGAHTSSTERRAERAERDLLEWKKVQLLCRRMGERLPGRITGVQPFGFFVQLEDYLVDGLVRVGSLEDDYYIFDPLAHELVGERLGRKFRLADRVEVELVGTDAHRRRLELTPVGRRRRRVSRSGSRSSTRRRRR